MFSPIEIAHGKAKLLAVDMVLVLPKARISHLSQDVPAHGLLTWPGLRF